MFSKNYKLNGFFSWQIIDIDGSIVLESKKKNNLILNQGLEYPSVLRFEECFISCCIGYGTTPPLLTDTGLVSEVKRSNTYYTEGQACYSYIDTDTFNIKRTFDFSTETQTVNYGEVGWSPENTPGNNLFSRSQLVDQYGNIGTITVNRNQFLRVVYTLQVTFSPYVLTPYLPQIIGYSAQGNYISQLIGLYGVDQDGLGTVFDSGYKTNEPSNNILDIFISTGQQSISGFGERADYSLGAYPQRATAYNYESGSLTKIYSANFGRASGTGYISTIGMGLSGDASKNCTFLHRFDTPQFKASDYEFSVYFNYTWGRL